MARPIPQASGFALAAETYLNRGGGKRLGGRGNRNAGWTYTKGPLKGKTEGEAMNKMRQLWAGASPAVKNKYARMSREGMLSSSEMEDHNNPEFQDPAAIRVATPGDHDGDGTPDAVQNNPAPKVQQRTANPNATSGAGRGRSIKKDEGFTGNSPEDVGEGKRVKQTGAPTPEETAAAQAGLRDALNGKSEYGATAWGGAPMPRRTAFSSPKTNPQPVSTDAPPNPGVVPAPKPTKSTTETPAPQPEAPAPQTAPVPTPSGVSPTVHQGNAYYGPESPGAGYEWTGMQSGAKKWTPVDVGPKQAPTPPPSDYDPRNASSYQGPKLPLAQAPQAQGQPQASGFAGPEVVFAPGVGYVPKAQAVEEPPISYDQYDQARSAWQGNPQGEQDPNLAVTRAFRNQQEARKRKTRR